MNSGLWSSLLGFSARPKGKGQRPNYGSNMLNNLRYAIRMLLKQPSYSLIAIVTLGLGIGASTAIFAVVNGVLLRPLPFKNSQQLVMVWLNGAEAAGGDRTPLSVADFNDWRAQSRSFDSISAYQYGVFNYVS